MTVLRPGLHVVRRDDHHLQVGVDPPWRVVLPDQPGVRRLLGDLAEGRPTAPATDAEHRALQALLRAEMLGERPGSVPPARHTVAVQAAGDMGDEVARVLRAAGCEVGDGPVALVLSPGEIARTDADAHVREGRPHLLVTGSARGWTLGPFVVPGEAACLRCVDAHRGEQDPRRALVVEQLAGLPAAPDDPALAAVAVAWAVRDVLTHLAGGRPSTWSATVELGADLRPRRREWSRHPHCGCSWA
ncbi:hypothetical protein [Nocardioides aquiterrae]|uniref:TOMM leader peptide-binding protein n=1 Tax=Nocardioides aquiterrae TaxID=203799 RepID=A0ABN1UBT9_9ACTN